MFWAKYFGPLTINLLNKNTTYYSQGITRPDMAIDIECEGYWNLCKKIWEGRDVVFAQGGKRPAHNMAEDTLFEKANILADIPDITIRDAFRSYDRILERVMEKVVPGCLVYLGIGPTATVMAYEIYKLGYQAIDMGHFVQFYHKNRHKIINLELVHREEMERLKEIERQFNETSRCN